ncbi:unnamed protein product [Cuscuta campestris]|uniref:CCHC-type domain-containing protein n=1 Tax=Cuscuta campestris TaxID=132261 RepID=A0A484KX24_9ASTE|nr:unnamed protein product [Cuscuta campestris]
MAQSAEIAHLELDPSKIKSSELALMRDLLGAPFKIHHPDAVGGISLTHNPAPERFLMMHYDLVFHGFKLPLHSFIREVCRNWDILPKQFTTNSHKYLVSYIQRCCEKLRTPSIGLGLCSVFRRFDGGSLAVATAGVRAVSGGSDLDPIVGADQVVGPTVRGFGPVGPAVRPAALGRWAGSVGPVEWGCLNGQRVGAAGMDPNVNLNYNHSEGDSVSPQQLNANQNQNAPHQEAPHGGFAGIPQMDPALLMQLMQQMLIMNQNALARQLEPRITLERLRKDGAEEFLGENIADPLVAFRWLERVRRVFENLKVPVGEWADLAVMLLQNNAYEWWKRTSRNADHPPQLTWEYFDHVFREKYIPESFVEEKREEFVHLEMVTMSLPEYRQLFDHEAEFAQDLVNTPKRRCDRFVKGMRMNLQEGMSTASRQDFGVMYEQAKEVVRTREGAKLVVKQKANKMPVQVASAGKAYSGKRPLSGSGIQSSKKAKSVPAHSVASSSKTRSSKHPMCESCGRNHPGECWRSLGLCMGCGQSGHYRRDCPTNPGLPFPTAAASTQTTAPRPAQIARGQLESPMLVSNPLGHSMSLHHVYRQCPLTTRGKIFLADLIELPYKEFDIILGMDWLTEHQAVVDCSSRTVRLRAPDGDTIMIDGELFPRRLSLSLICKPRDWSERSEDDEFCRMTRDLVSSGKRPDFTVGADGILFFRNRLVVPCGAVRERLLHPTHRLPEGAVTLDENLTYEEEPEQILAREVKELRNKRVPLVKVLWRNHAVEEATWKTEESMRVQARCSEPDRTNELRIGLAGPKIRMPNKIGLGLCSVFRRFDGGSLAVATAGVRAVSGGSDLDPIVGADQVVGPTVQGVGPLGPSVRPATLGRWAGSVGPVEWGCLNGQRVGAAGSVRQLVG